MIAAAAAAFFLLILMMDFQPGDDLMTISFARRQQTLRDVFTASTFDRGEYYRPMLLLVAKLPLTASFSALPYRIELAALGLAVFLLAIGSLRNLGVSLAGVALAVFVLIGSPFTHDVFTWWAHIGAHFALFGFMVGAYFITKGKPPPWFVAFPVLAVGLLMQELSLVVGALYFCTYIAWRDYKGAAGIFLLVLGYAVLRTYMLGAMSSKGIFLQFPQGFFFTEILNKEQWVTMFGGRYWLLYPYNAVSQFFAIFFAEPHSGLLSFSRWRHLVYFVLQTGSSILLLTFLWRHRDRKTMRIAALFLIVILANVVVGFGSTRFRTITVAGPAHLLLFVWAADSMWKKTARHDRWLGLLTVALFIGWGGQAALRLTDIVHGVQNQGKAYINMTQFPEEIDSDLFNAVRARYLPADGSLRSP